MSVLLLHIDILIRDIDTAAVGYLAVDDRHLPVIPVVDLKCDILYRIKYDDLDPMLVQPLNIIL